MADEVEVKLSLDGRADPGKLLRASGFRILHRRVFERNLLFDTPSGALRKKGQVLRLRQAGGKAKLTFKSPQKSDKHKSREELEVEIAALDPVAGIFERLEFRRVFTYEKFRTEYAESVRRGVVTVDETPIGNFLEIEGPPAWIDRTARKLGFRESEYITQSYPALYFERCRRQKVTPGDMVFPVK